MTTFIDWRDLPPPIKAHLDAAYDGMSWGAPTAKPKPYSFSYRLTPVGHKQSEHSHGDDRQHKP